MVDRDDHAAGVGSAPRVDPDLRTDPTLTRWLIGGVVLELLLLFVLLAPFAVPLLALLTSLRRSRWRRGGP
ncbi:hypothetical protein [Homoserinibacter sp. YIM 151385]|uniref:hypothetical protein n=1 Tax=Homoserinibacter sp. YIM 151385 TaxID=2985506 RepID=UPI0022F090EC|nr:hypothetical protein [Homoserinibacter sp. YIM 151385]WBU39240.1 hypothetical protein OF852_06595 [Homoserinibacter sp. YIM 151385]